MSKTCKPCCKDGEPVRMLLHTKKANIHILTLEEKGEGAIPAMFKATADYVVGDSFLVNGEAYTPVTQDGTALRAQFFKAGGVVSVAVDTVTKRLGFPIGTAGTGKVPVEAAGKLLMGDEQGNITNSTIDADKVLQVITEPVEGNLVMADIEGRPIMSRVCADSVATVEDLPYTKTLPLPMLNGWHTYAFNESTFGPRVSVCGKVGIITGRITGGTNEENTVIAKLPEGTEPQFRTDMMVADSYVAVQPNGAIILQTKLGSPNSVILNNVYNL